MYRLTVTDEADEYANDTGTTGAITVGGTASGVIVPMTMPTGLQ